MAHADSLPQMQACAKGEGSPTSGGSGYAALIELGGLLIGGAPKIRGTHGLRRSSPTGSSGMPALAQNGELQASGALLGAALALVFFTQE